MRPTLLPQNWATNVNFAGGPNIGTPTKVAASGGRIADGWRNEDVPPAQEQNYWQARIAEWALYGADFIGEGDTAAMVATVPSFDGAMFHVYEAGVLVDWYYWTTTPVATADNAFWVFDGTGGQWVNTNWNASRYALVGVVPGVTGSTAGRILQSQVPYGHFYHATTSAYTHTTTSASTTNEFTNISLVAQTLVTGDIIRGRIPAVVGISGGAPLPVTASVWISENNGSTYAGKSPGGAAPAYYIPTSTAVVAVVMDFNHVVGVGNTGVKISIRGSSDGTNTLSLYLGLGLIEVIRL